MPPHEKKKEEGRPRVIASGGGILGKREKGEGKDRPVQGSPTLKKRKGGGGGGGEGKEGKEVRGGRISFIPIQYLLDLT